MSEVFETAMEMAQFDAFAREPESTNTDYLVSVVVSEDNRQEDTIITRWLADTATDDEFDAFIHQLRLTMPADYTGLGAFDGLDSDSVRSIRQLPVEERRAAWQKTWDAAVSDTLFRSAIVLSATGQKDEVFKLIEEIEKRGGHPQLVNAATLPEEVKEEIRKASEAQEAARTGESTTALYEA